MKHKRAKQPHKCLLQIIIFLVVLILAGSSAMANEQHQETDSEIWETAEGEIVIEDAVSFTPDGNLTLIDDIQRSDDADKQYITVQTRDGSLFFIVIDRSAKQNNVYFLNLVDDKDLIALLNDPALTEEIENILRNPVITAAPSQDSPDPEDPEIKQESVKSGKVLVIVALLLVAGGVIFWIIRFKPFARKRQKDFVVPEYVFDDENEPDDIEDNNNNESDEFAHKDE